MFKWVLCEEVMSTLSYVSWEWMLCLTRTFSLPSTLRPRLVYGVLMVAMVRGITVHENEVEVFQWTLCNVAAYFADDSVMRMGVLSHQRTFPLPGIVKQDM